MKKLVPIEQLMEEAEDKGVNPSRLMVNPNEVFSVDSDDLDEIEENEESEEE